MTGSSSVSPFCRMVAARCSILCRGKNESLASKKIVRCVRSHGSVSKNHHACSGFLVPNFLIRFCRMDKAAMQTGTPRTTSLQPQWLVSKLTPVAPPRSTHTHTHTHTPKVTHVHHTSSLHCWALIPFRKSHFEK